MRKFFLLFLICCMVSIGFAEDVPATSDVEFPQPIKGFGVATHWGRRYDGWKVEEYIDKLKLIGASFVRDEIPWAIVERKKGEYKIPKVSQNWVDKIHSENMDIILILDYTNKNYPNKYTHEGFVNYSKFIAKHFEGKINTFEIWNEPNNFYMKQQFGGEWNAKGPCPWLKVYAEQIDLVSRALRKVRPDATILAGVSIPPADLYMINRYPQKLKNIDGLVWHAYPYSLPPETQPWGGDSTNKRDGIKSADDDHSFASVARILRETMKKKLKKDLPLWITEVGYTSYNQSKKPNSLYRGFTREAKAAYLVRMVVQALSTKGVAVVTVYDLKDDHHGNPNDAEANFGLFDWHGKAKPSAKAFMRLAKYIGGERKNIYNPPFRTKCEVVFKLKTDNWQRDSVGSFVKLNGPQYFWFKTSKVMVCVFWKGGRYNKEVNMPFIAFTPSQKQKYQTAEAMDLVTGEKLDCKKNDNTWRVQLDSNPRVILFKEKK